MKTQSISLSKLSFFYATVIGENAFKLLLILLELTFWLWKGPNLILACFLCGFLITYLLTRPTPNQVFSFRKTSFKKTVQDILAAETSFLMSTLNTSSLPDLFLYLQSGPLLCISGYIQLKDLSFLTFFFPSSKNYSNTSSSLKLLLDINTYTWNHYGNDFYIFRIRMP